MPATDPMLTLRIRNEDGTTWDELYGTPEALRKAATAYGKKGLVTLCIDPPPASTLTAEEVTALFSRMGD